MKRSRVRCRWLVLVAASAVLASGGCRASPRRALPAAPPEVVVTMQDVGGYRFDYDHHVPAGRVVFRVVNAGRLMHSLTLVPLPDDFPPIDQQLRGTERQTITPFAGVPEHLPGETATFAVDLAPGRRYAMICFVQDPDEVSHALKGMSSEFRAGGG